MQESYPLENITTTDFYFPHPVRHPSQITVSVVPGDVVPPSEYEVIGYGATASGVTIRYPDAPVQEDKELRVVRRTEPERQTVFESDVGATAQALNVEFDHLYQVLDDFIDSFEAVVDDLDGQEGKILTNDGTKAFWSELASIEKSNLLTIIIDEHEEDVLQYKFGAWRNIQLPVSKLIDQKYFKTVEDYGAVGDGETDDTDAIQAALNAGCAIFGAKTYLISDTLIVYAPDTFIWARPYEGVHLLYKDDGGPITPALYLHPNSIRSYVWGLQIDHQGEDDTGDRAPTERGGDYIWGSTLLLGSTMSAVVNCFVTNGWSNGICVGAFDPQDPEELYFNFPRQARVIDCRTWKCGLGYHPEDPNQASPGGKNGAGVNIATGGLTAVIGCADWQSSTGFIMDMGGGATGTFNACYSFKATDRNPSNVDWEWAGYGFWIGGSECNVIGCGSNGADRDGFHIGGGATRVSLNSCYSHSSKRNGFRISSCSGINLSDCRSIVPEGEAHFVIRANDTTAGDIGIYNCVGRPVSGESNPDYGLKVDLENGGYVYASVWGGVITGEVEDYYIPQSASVTIMEDRGGVTRINAPDAGVESSGSAVISQAKYNAPFTIGRGGGSASFWVDGDSKLRVKIGAYPSNDTDGEVIAGE